MINITVFAEYGKDTSGKQIVVYTLKEDGNKRGGDLLANPDISIFISEARRFIDLVRSRGKDFSVLVDSNTDHILMGLAQQAASAI